MTAILITAKLAGSNTRGLSVERFLASGVAA